MLILSAVCMHMSITVCVCVSGYIQEYLILILLYKFANWIV